MSQPPRRTFSGSDEAALRTRRNITPTDNAGMIRISRRRFQNSSSDDSEDATALLESLALSSPSGSANADSASVLSPVTEPERDIMIEIPTNLHSETALQYLGLSPAAARDIMQAWTNLNSEDFADFCTFAKDYLENRGASIDTGDYRSDWKPVLRRIGASEKLIEAICQPGYDEVRLTKTALGWVKEAMEVRWEFLLQGEEASRQRARQIEGTNVPIQSFHAFTYQVGSGTSFDTIPTPAGETVLWKATTRIRAGNMWSNKLRQGEFDIQSLVSSPPTDFNGWSKAYYWTPEMQGAIFYMKYCRAINHHAGACLVRLSVPNHIIEKEPAYILRFPSEDFKKTVFFSRSGQSLKKKVDIVLQHRLLIGDTTKGNSDVFNKLSKWEEVGEQHLVKLPDGSRMTQYVFDDDVADEINKHCANKVHLVKENRPDEYLPPLSPARHY
ncbi:hypothetical protein KCU98_g12276, partial [Aureobasidium melanogenum]